MEHFKSSNPYLFITLEDFFYFQVVVSEGFIGRDVVLETQDGWLCQVHQQPDNMVLRENKLYCGFPFNVSRIFFIQ